MTGPDPIRDCKHGRLKRKCEECDSEARIATLEAQGRALADIAMQTKAMWMDETASLRGQIRDLQRTVAFFASVIKSGEGWSEQCDRAWPVTLEPCIHDFHRAEHGIMPCTKCGADAPPVAATKGEP